MSQEIFKSDDQKVQQLNEGPQGMRLVTSETKQLINQQPVIEFSQQKTLIQTQNDAPLKQIQQLPPPRIQSQNVLRQNMQIPQVSYPGTYSVHLNLQEFISNHNMTIQQNCQQAPPLCMNIVVVLKYMILVIVQNLIKLIEQYQKKKQKLLGDQNVNIFNQLLLIWKEGKKLKQLRKQQQKK